MRLGKTKNNELLDILTDDLEIIIKDESGGAALTFIVSDTRESSVNVWCSSTVYELAIRGVEDDAFANVPIPISLACDPIFVEQRNYSLYAEVRGENSSDRKLEFDHENVSLRKSVCEYCVLVSVLP